MSYLQQSGCHIRPSFDSISPVSSFYLDHFNQPSQRCREIETIDINKVVQYRWQGQEKDRWQGEKGKPRIGGKGSEARNVNEKYGKK